MKSIVVGLVACLPDIWVASLYSKNFFWGYHVFPKKLQPDYRNYALVLTLNDSSPPGIPSASSWLTLTMKLSRGEFGSTSTLGIKNAATRCVFSWMLLLVEGAYLTARITYSTKTVTSIVIDIKQNGPGKP
jgi:hypothetical protein